MIKQINFRNSLVSKEPAAKKAVAKKPAKYANNLEYELIASLVLQQYVKQDQIKFNQLLSIPLQDRIPGFMAEYGKKRMHQLLTMIIRAFIYTLPLPKTKKLSETKISVLACDIMISSYEDQLSLEDIILFFEQVKKGKYGKIKMLLHHQILMEMLESYRQERHNVYRTIQKEKEESGKALGPVERTSPEPTSIGDLFHQTPVIEMNKRKSG